LSERSKKQFLSRHGSFFSYSLKPVIHSSITIMKTTFRPLIFGLAGLFILLTHTAFSQSSECGHIAAGSISFNPGSCSIQPAAQTILGGLAEQMRFDPGCRVVIMGNAGGSKPGQQLSWQRVQSTIEQMSESHNIDRNRFIFIYDGTAAIDHVDFRAANPGEEGPSYVAPPYPGGKGCK